MFRASQGNNHSLNIEYVLVVQLQYNMFSKTVHSFIHHHLNGGLILLEFPIKTFVWGGEGSDFIITLQAALDVVEADLSARHLMEHDHVIY